MGKEDGSSRSLGEGSYSCIAGGASVKAPSPTPACLLGGCLLRSRSGGSPQPVVAGHLPCRVPSWSHKESPASSKLPLPSQLPCVWMVISLVAVYFRVTFAGGGVFFDRWLCLFGFGD